MKIKISSILFIVISVIAVLYGMLYLFSGKIMGYHEAFIGLSYDELCLQNQNIAKLIVGLMHIVGACFVSIGIGVFIISQQLKKQFSKSLWWAILFLLLISLSVMLYVTSYIASNIASGVKPPWYLVLFLIITTVIALVLSYKNKSIQ